MATPRFRAQGRSLHVLVVDDEAPLLERARERLEGEGHRVTTVDSARHVATVIRALDPDVVLMDVMMPDLSGRQLSDLLDVRPAGRGPAIILHSSIPARALRHAIDIGAALGVITKTADDVEFFFAFNGLIDRLPATALRSDPRHRVPAASGTHRIPTDDEETTDVDSSTQHWFSRTSPGQR